VTVFSQYYPQYLKQCSFENDLDPLCSSPYYIKHTLEMGKSGICVNEPLNNHSQWLSEKSPQHLLMENQELYFCS
jgi:hypothetical protein